eukprot:1143419-Pelagomonas_calceolata.AAC.5
MARGAGRQEHGWGSFKARASASREVAPGAAGAAYERSPALVVAGEDCAVAAGPLPWASNTVFGLQAHISTDV